MNCRPGKLRTIDDERVSALVRKVLRSKPKNGATHWSVRTVEAETGISKSSVHRYLNPGIARQIRQSRTGNPGNRIRQGVRYLRNTEPM
jgi:hypothetical protein